MISVRFRYGRRGKESYRDLQQARGIGRCTSSRYRSKHSQISQVRMYLCSLHQKVKMPDVIRARERSTRPRICRGTLFTRWPISPISPCSLAHLTRVRSARAWCIREPAKTTTRHTSGKAFSVLLNPRLYLQAQEQYRNTVKSRKLPALFPSVTLARLAFGTVFSFMLVTLLKRSWSLSFYLVIRHRWFRGGMQGNAVTSR